MRRLHNCDALTLEGPDMTSHPPRRTPLLAIIILSVATLAVLVGLFVRSQTAPSRPVTRLPLTIDFSSNTVTFVSRSTLPWTATTTVGPWSNSVDVQPGATLTMLVPAVTEGKAEQVMIDMTRPDSSLRWSVAFRHDCVSASFGGTASFSGNADDIVRELGK